MVKCMEDPVYFIKNYVKIQHPTKGAMMFSLYDYQEELVNTFVDNNDVIVLSARQTGKTVTVSAYLLWFAMFQEDKTVLIASNKDENAMELIKRVQYAYENLPIWLKPGVKEDGWNKHEVSFENKSRIVSTATSPTSGRGYSISLLYLDEFAFVPQDVQEEFWTSILPVLSTGGECIITSTPNGDVDKFSELWRGANTGSNDFTYFEVKWDQPPDRDEKFKKKIIGKLGELKWRQEYECRFLSSDAMLIDALVIERLAHEIRDLKPEFSLKDIRFWSKILPGKVYLVGVDPATGSGEDFSAIQVFSFPELIQIAEYRSKTMSTNNLYGVLKNLIKYIEKQGAMAFFSIENNGVGEGLMALYEADEHPPEKSELVDEEGKNRRGMTTTTKSKIKACVDFKEMIERDSMKVKSPILFKEMQHFVRSKGSYAAQKGATDDCVSGCLIITRIVQEIASFDQQAFEKLYGNPIDDWSKEGGTWDIEEYDENDEGVGMIFG